MNLVITGPGWGIGRALDVNRPVLNFALAAPRTGRLPVLDELKGLAILMVILYHAGSVLAWQNFAHGDLGVDIFVIISGIGLTLGSSCQGLRPFLIRRFLRIFPVYWVALTLFLACNTYFLQSHYSPLNIIIHYLGIHGWFGGQYGMAINDSFWFITLILSLYVLFCGLEPLLGRPDRLLLVGSVISVTLAVTFLFANQTGLFGYMALRIPGFFAGLLVGQLLKSGRLGLPLTTTLVLAAFLFTYVPFTQGIVFHTFVAGLGVMGAYIWLWKPLAPVRTEASVARGLKFFGDRSLEIFVLHEPLIRDYNIYLQRRWFGIGVPAPCFLAVGIILGLAITVIASVILHALLARIPH